MDDATAKSTEIQVFLTSFAGLAYLSFGIKTWVISRFAEELGLNAQCGMRAKNGCESPRDLKLRVLS